MLGGHPAGSASGFVASSDALVPADLHRAARHVPFPSLCPGLGCSWRERLPTTDVNLTLVRSWFCLFSGWRFFFLSKNVLWTVAAGSEFLSLLQRSEGAACGCCVEHRRELPVA